MTSKSLWRAAVVLLVGSSTLLTPLFAYTVNTTPLTDSTYTPVAPNYLDYNGLWSGRKGAKDVDLAIITLNFGRQEIGTDFYATVVLARKEAARLGATAYWVVSGTVFKDTEEIAAQTFHLIRNENAIATINTIEDGKREAVEKAEFNRLSEGYHIAIEQTKIWPTLAKAFRKFSSLPEAEQARKVGATLKTITLKNGNKTSKWYDPDTKNPMPAKVRRDRISDYVIKEVRINDAATYRESFNELRAINEEYAAKNSDVVTYSWFDPTVSIETAIPNDIVEVSSGFEKDRAGFFRTLKAETRLRIFLKNQAVAIPVTFKSFDDNQQVIYIHDQAISPGTPDIRFLHLSEIQTVNLK